MTVAISPATPIVALPMSPARLPASGETFSDIFNDAAPQAGAPASPSAAAAQGAAMPDAPCVDIIAEFSGLAQPQPAAGQPDVAAKDSSDAKLKELPADSNVPATDMAKVAAELTSPQLIAAVAKAIAPQSDTATSPEANRANQTGGAAAIAASGQTHQRPSLAQASPKRAIDAAAVSKAKATPAFVGADLTMLDAAPDTATTTVTTAATGPINTFQPAPAFAAGTPDVRQLYVTPDNQWIDTLRHEIVSSAARDNQLQFTLQPEHLGKLDIILTTQDGKVDIRFDTSTSAAAHILATEQVQLIEDLRQVGVKVGQFEMTNSQDGARQNQRQQRDIETSDPQPTPKPSTLSNEMRGRFA